MKDLQEFKTLAKYINKFNNLRGIQVSDRFENSRRDKEIQATLRKISSIETLVNTPQYHINTAQEFKVHIKISNKVAHGMFIPLKDSPGQWMSSEQTYRALKKDIFSLAENIDELMEPHDCSSCKSSLDKQFWHFCPYCGQGF